MEKFKDHVTALLVGARLSGQEITVKYLYSIASKRSKTLFLSWLLVDPQDGCIRFAKNQKQRKAIQDVADLLRKSLNEKVTDEQWQQVRNAAAYAAAAAAYAAADADADAYAAAAYDDAAAAYAAAAAAYAAADADADAYAAAAKQVKKFIEIISHERTVTI